LSVGVVSPLGEGFSDRLGDFLWTVEEFFESLSVRDGVRYVFRCPLFVCGGIEFCALSVLGRVLAGGVLATDVIDYVNRTGSSPETGELFAGFVDIPLDDILPGEIVLGECFEVFVYVLC
jgi:hypothetical protein